MSLLLPIKAILSNLQEQERFLELQVRVINAANKNSPGNEVINAVKVHFINMAHVRVQDAIANLIAIIKINEP